MRTLRPRFVARQPLLHAAAPSRTSGVVDALALRERSRKQLATLFRLLRGRTFDGKSNDGIVVRGGVAAVEVALLVEGRGMEDRRVGTVGYFGE